jgi:hypothetical protein
MHRLVGVLQRVVKCWGDTINGAEKKSEAPLKGSSERTRIVTNRSRSWPRIAQPWIRPRVINTRPPASEESGLCL